MLNGRHLTIQDYFKQAHPTRGTNQVRRHAFRGAATGRKVFSDTLDAVRTRMNKSRQGCSIQDYMQNPVRAKRFIRLSHPVNFSTAAPEPAIARIPVKVPVSSSLQAQAVKRTTPMQRNAQRIEEGVEKAAAKYDLPPGLLHAVIRAESNYQVDAVSPAGAQGLMQLMPATAKELGVRNTFNIEQNIDGGAKYLRNMLTRFKGDLKLALSAYNAGPGNVEKYQGLVPFEETRTYVARVLRYAGQFTGPMVKSS